MTTATAFKVLLKKPLIIGDDAPIDDQEEREIGPFSLEGNFARGERCLLQYEVRGLTVANEHPSVEVNDRTVGHIQVCDVTGAGNDYIADRIWFQQSIVIEPGYLRPGRNLLEIKAPDWQHSNTHNKYDDFHIRNVVLMYKTINSR